MEFKSEFSAQELRLFPTKPLMTYLHPGQMEVSAEPTTLTTILGSCVAVCLWESAKKVGGMVHYLLPTWDPSRASKSFRYGDVALESLIESMEKLNCRKSLMQARVFGGACVLGAFRKQNKQHLGERNAELAFAILSKHRIPVAECDTGGDVARKLLFNTNTGEVKLTRLEDRDGV